MPAGKGCVSIKKDVIFWSGVRDRAGLPGTSPLGTSGLTTLPRPAGFQGRIPLRDHNISRAL